MKKILIGGLVGGILLFAWQTISWTVANLHEKGQQYTTKQDSIMSYLNNSGLPEGSYMLPRAAPGTTMEEMEKQMASAAGKPWARLTYYKSMDANMVINMVRGILANIIIVSLLCWIFAKINSVSFSNYFISSLAVGIICFVNGAYTGHIWYPMFDINAHMIDALASWGLVGVWLGWWMSKK